MVQNILDERLLTALKEKAPLYVYVSGVKKNQQNKKGRYIILEAFSDQC